MPCGSEGTERSRSTVATRHEVDRKTLRAYRRVEPVMRPLLELFATVDDVMSEADAFEPGNIHKSLGRIYREWLETREALDPEFDRARYRHEMKSRPKKSPLGRPVKGSSTSSTGRTSTSDKSRKKTGRTEKPSAGRSATTARSSGSASGSRSTTGKRGAYGEGSPRRSGSVSESGSTGRTTRGSRKAKG